MASMQAAEARQQQLTKPAGSLGRLEQLAVSFAGWQGKTIPSIERIALRVFAADHGVTAHGVSAYPPQVTLQMVQNIAGGGAAVSVLSRTKGVDFALINLGTFESTANLESELLSEGRPVEHLALMPGTHDFTLQEAMSADTLDACLEVGRSRVDALNCELFIAGEMGIGNTTSASAITAALLGLPVEHVIGKGTGLDSDGLQRKQTAVSAALALHAKSMKSPLHILRSVGGLEIAAMTGAYLRCAQRGVPVLLDGFISTVAACIAEQINPGVKQWLIAGHQSVEPGHAYLLEALNVEPLLRLDMRLGEGSGAAVALGVVRDALNLHSDMATFEEAGVSGSENS